jgi:hypothetical protein
MICKLVNLLNVYCEPIVVIFETINERKLNLTRQYHVLNSITY